MLSRIAKLSLERTTTAILPWLIPLLMSLIAITLIPELTLWLPRVTGLIKWRFCGEVFHPLHQAAGSAARPL